MLQDEDFMKIALEEAQKAFQEGEVPVGAVLVHSGAVVARAHNQVEKFKDATAHAEILCLRAASYALQNWRLVEATLYTTLEPCCMCAGAIILSRIHRVVWGAPDIRQGADGSWVQVLNAKHPIHNVATTGGVLLSESAFLMKTFFQQRREGEWKKYLTN